MNHLQVFVLAAMAGLTGCSNTYCENQHERSEQDVMVMHEKLTVEYAGEQYEHDRVETTYDWLDESELKVRDASDATGHLTLGIDNAVLMLPLPLTVGTHVIEGPPPSEWLDPASSLSGVRGGYRGRSTNYGTATGSVEVLSTAPLSFEFTISGMDSTGAAFEGSGSFDSWADRMADPLFECND